MKKSTVKNTGVSGSLSETPSRGPGYVVSCHTPDSLVGRVMEIIEAIGLPDKQEVSVKNLIKGLVYSKFDETDSVFIGSDLCDAIFTAKRTSGEHVIELKDIR